MRVLKSHLKTSVAALCVVLPCAAFAEAPIIVTSGADAGADSLRAALATAAASGAPSTIVLAPGTHIDLASGLTYGGTDALAIHGNGARITSLANITLLTASEGADLTLTGLTLQGPGGFDINNRGDIDQTAGKGIFVDVRNDQSGVVTLRLSDVTVANVAGHGVHISDCSLADDCGSGGGGAGEGSPASISVVFSDVTIDGVGQGRFDADGLRVDERSAGSIYLVATGSTFMGVGADGAELDEGQDGDVIVMVTDTLFIRNGDYCDPAILSAFMPAEPEGEFELGKMTEAEIPGPITTSPDDRCFEREVDLHEDGSVEEYEFAIDVDDGFDIDEAGAGSILATVTRATISDNFDEGLDFDEEGAGSIELAIFDSTARGNTDDAIKNSEEGPGHAIGIVANVSVTNNGGVGVVFEEEGEGDTHVVSLGGITMGNDDGDTGFEVVQDDDGFGTFKIMGTTIADGTDTDGVVMANG